MSRSKTTLRKVVSTKRKNTIVGEISAAKRRRDQLIEVCEDNKKANCVTIPSKVFSFGTGDAGQLGLGEDIFEKKRPCLIPDLNDIIKISSGAMHTICLNNKGEVFTFGCNDEGALGRHCEDDSESTIPGKVKFPNNEKIKDVTAGDSHSSALSEDGILYVWGGFRDNNGLIGLVNANERETEPVSVKFDKSIVKVVSGDNHIAVLLEDGTISTFGVSENGQLGRVSDRHLVRGGRAGLDSILKPERVRNCNNTVRYCDIWAGSYCTVARAANGNLFGCGLNNYKQLVNTEELSILMMTPLEDLNKLGEIFRYIGFGQHHNIGLTESNRVFTVGRGEYGSLGLGNNDNISVPQEVKISDSPADVLCVYSCNRASYMLLRDGTCYSWGAGDTYMLSHGDDEDVNIPIKMVGKQLEGKKIIELSPGAQHVVLRVIEDDKTNDREQVLTTIEENSELKLNDLPNKVIEEKSDCKEINNNVISESVPETGDVDMKEVNDENKSEKTEQKKPVEINQ